MYVHVCVCTYVCIHVYRLRDISTQEKQEHQQTLKELDHQSSVADQLVEDKEKLREELLEAENIIDQLNEQVDAALGAEEMVEKLTDRNLNLEEKVQVLQEQVDDLVRFGAWGGAGGGGGEGKVRTLCMSLYKVVTGMFLPGDVCVVCLSSCLLE